MCMVANVVQDSTAVLPQHKVAGMMSPGSRASARVHKTMNVRAKLLAKAQELREQMDTIAAGARASALPTKAPAGPVNSWGDKSCTTWVITSPKRCSAPNYKQNCAKACAKIAAAAAAESVSAALINVWGDASCAAWVSQDAKRCGAPNYKTNCAKQCAEQNAH